jgi:hypothetical protein
MWNSTIWNALQVFHYSGPTISITKFVYMKCTSAYSSRVNVKAFHQQVFATRNNRSSGRQQSDWEQTHYSGPRCSNTLAFNMMTVINRPAVCRTLFASNDTYDTFPKSSQGVTEPSIACTRTFFSHPRSIKYVRKQIWLAKMFVLASILQKKLRSSKIGTGRLKMSIWNSVHQIRTDHL